VLRRVGATGDLIGLADAIDAAAFWRLLVFVDEARARGDAIARIDAGAELVGGSAVGKHEGDRCGKGDARDTRAHHVPHPSLRRSHPRLKSPTRTAA
jgi:hypothetical protein